MAKFKFSVPVKSSDLVYPIQKLLRETTKLSSIYRQQDLSPSQGHILVCIDKFGPMTIIGLTSELGLDKSTISQTLSTLQERGYIELNEKGDDRRYKQASLTISGEAKVQTINQEFDRALSRMVSELEQKDLNAVGYGLMRFVEMLGKVRQVSFRRIMGATQASNTAKPLFNLD